MPPLRPALAAAAVAALAATAVFAAPAAAQLSLPDDPVISARALPGTTPRAG